MHSTYTRLASSFFLAFLFLLLVKPGATSGAPTDAQILVHNLSQLRYHLIELQSIAIEYSAIIQLPEPKTGRMTIGSGTYSFLFRDGKYRVVCSTDPELGLADDVELAWNGAKLFFLDKPLSILSYRSWDAENLPTALPNPLFLPFDFLRDLSPDCPQCWIRLRHLSDDRLWLTALDGANTKSQDLLIPNLGPDAGYSIHRLRFQGYELGSPEMLQTLSLERIADNGSTLASIDIDSFRQVVGNGASIQVPERVRLTVRDASGSRTLATAKFSLVRVAINQEIPASSFEISPDRAASVWDGDASLFIKSSKK